MAYKNGVVSVGTSATLIASPSGGIPDNGGILIQNLGTTVLYLGGSTVTANTASTGGLQVAANATVTVPTSGAYTVGPGLYGVSTAAVNVAFLYPA